MRLVMPDPVGLTVEHMVELSHLTTLTAYEARPGNEQELLRRVNGADAMTAFYVKVGRNLIENTPTLKYIFVLAVGYDSVDVHAAAQAGIQVINCPTHNYIAVAEHAIGLMLAVTRKVVESNLELKRGAWRPASYEGPELNGKTLGLVGYGNIGKAVGRLAQAFGMRVQYANSQTGGDELDRLLTTSDIVALCLPLTAQTRHLMDARRLQLMKEGAFLINTSRGAIIDQQALLAALKTGHLGGAALDVFEGEPFRGQVDQQTLELVQLSNVVATPHIASDTPEVLVRLGAELISNVKAVLSGRPINVVG